MAETDLLRRINGLESRLTRLEELLGVIGAMPIQTSNMKPAQADSTVSAAGAATSNAPATPVIDYQQPRPATPLRHSQLEQMIGLKWAGWIGAVVLVIGAALGIEFAYQQGWLHIVTPAVGLAVLALGGVALLAAGEWVYRKVNVLSAAGLFGSGVAILFVVSYAGYRYYDLYTRACAFAFMAGCTLIGAAVARRGNLVSIAVLSLIGGGIAPLLISEGHPALLGFLTYLLMLQTVSLVLAAWGATPKWWTLRGLSLATTSIWVAAVSDGSPHETLFLSVILFAAFYQAELLWSAWHSRLGRAHAGAGFSLLITAMFIFAGLHLLEDSSNSIRTLFVLASAAVTGAIGVISRKSHHRSAALRALAISFATQTLGLIVLAVPVGLPNRWVATAWAGLALVVAILGRLLGNLSERFTSAGARLSAGAMPVIGLAVLKWIAVDTLAARLAEPWISGLALYGGVAVLAGLIGIYLLTAKPVAGGLIPRRIPVLLISQCVAVLFWLGSVAIDQIFNSRHLGSGSLFGDPRRAEQVALSIFWAVFALISIGCGFSWRAAGLRYFGLTLFAITLVKVVAIDMSQISSGYRILSFMGVGLLLLTTSVVYGKVSPVLLGKGD